MTSRFVQNQQAFEHLYSIFQKKKNEHRLISNRKQQQFQWIQENNYLRNRQKQLEMQIDGLCSLNNITKPDFNANIDEDQAECNAEDFIKQLTDEIENDMKVIHHDTSSKNIAIELPQSHRDCSCIRNIERIFKEKKMELEQCYEMKLHEYQDKFEKYCEQINVSVRSRTGRWDVCLHERFESVYSSYFREQNSRQKLFLQLVHLIPSKSKSDIKQHMDWFQKYRTYHVAMKDHKNAFKRDTETLQNELISAQIEALSKCEAERESFRQKQLLDQKCEYLHSRLAHLRTEWDDRIQEVQQRQIEQQLIDEHNQSKERMKWRKHQEMNHKLIEQFRKEKAEHAAIEFEILKQIEEHHRQTQIDVNGINQERVKYRQKCLEERHAQRQAMIEAGLLEVEKRRHRLESIKKLVEVHAERDPERVLQETISSKCRHDATMNSNSTDCAPFKHVHGYNMDQLIADRRFAVGLALSESGLYNSDYGHWLMLSGQYNQML